MRTLHYLNLVLCGWCCWTATWAQDPPPSPTPSAAAAPATVEPMSAPTHKALNTLTIAYIDLQEDARYDDKRMVKHFFGQALGRPYVGTEVALKEVKFHGQAAGVQFALQHVTGKDSADLIKQLEALSAQGLQYVVADLPAAQLLEVSQAFKDKAILFFNATATDDALRQTQCQANIYHTIPNIAMQTDGLVQYLVAHKWRNVLVLEGTLPEDKLLTTALERSAKRYGAKLVEKRNFVLGTDPREREQNNVALLTGGEYDIVYIADTQGEFARNAAYQTLLPRPVVGSEGLNALAWNWAWERHGAPQIEKRFEKQAERPMTAPDWGAWMAVKVIATAVQQTQTQDFAQIRAYLTADNASFDGAKGNPSSFRPWDHQLRQPLLVSTHNWVVERAPLQGFLHQTNNLDTLGFDKPDSLCKF